MAWRRKKSTRLTSLSASGDWLYFIRWFPQSKFKMMASFLPQLEHVPNADERPILKARFARAGRHANVVLQIKLAVTVLLVLAGGSTIVSSAVRALDWLPGARETVLQIAGIASAVALGLLVLRFALDRHLARVEVYMQYIAMQVAGERTKGATTPESPPQ